MGAVYAYELRRGKEIFSTGRLASEHELSPGDQVNVAGIVAEVEDVAWVEGELRLLLQPSLRLTAT